MLVQLVLSTALGLRAADLAEGFLRRRVEAVRARLDADAVVLAAHARSADPRILELDRELPWEEPVFAHALPVFYAVYPVPSGNWMVDAMPPAPGSFAQRLPLPEVWAGLRDAELAATCGVPDAVFAHARRFVGAARSREGALAMARRAIEIGSGSSEPLRRAPVEMVRAMRHARPSDTHDEARHPRRASGINNHTTYCAGQHHRVARPSIAAGSNQTPTRERRTDRRNRQRSRPPFCPRRILTRALPARDDRKPVRDERTRKGTQNDQGSVSLFDDPERRRVARQPLRRELQPLKMYDTGRAAPPGETQTHPGPTPTRHPVGGRDRDSALHAGTGQPPATR